MRYRRRLPSWTAADENLPDFIAAGHDRSVIAIKPDHLDAWLNPQASGLAAMVAILDDTAAVTYAYAPAERGLPDVDEHE